MTKTKLPLDEIIAKAIKQLYFITSRRPDAKKWIVTLDSSGKVTAQAVFHE